MPSQDVTDRQTVEIRSHIQCAVLCDWEPLCQGLEITSTDEIMLCHMAMGPVDSIPVDGN